MASDFELNVEITAETDKLDAGMKKATGEFKKNTMEMEKAATKSGGGMEKMLGVIGKVGAVLFLGEAAFKGAGAAARAMTGDTEAAANLLKGFPIIGPLITSIWDFGDALVYASNSANDARDAALTLKMALGDLEAGIAVAQDRLADYNEMWQLQGDTAEEIAIKTANMTWTMLKDQETLEVEAAKKRHEERMKEIDDAHLHRKLEFHQQMLELHRHGDEMEEIKKKFERKNRLNRMRQLKAQADQERIAAEEAEEERQKRAEKAAEEKKKIEEDMHAFMQEKHKEELARIAEREAAEKEAAEARQAFAKASHDAHMEFAEARLEAEEAVRGATATFQTAGGSFTSAAQAKVSEEKLLRSISEQSRDFLAEIVRNTGLIAAGGFA